MAENNRALGWAGAGPRRSSTRGRRQLSIYLLDTNIISDVVRNPEGNVVDALALASDETVTSVVVAGELRAWIAKNESKRLERLIATTLVAIPVLPLGPEVADIYGDLRIRLERVGTLIGSNDLWIAAHAISLGAIMVTDNVREFARVPDLPLENWLRR